MALKHFFRRPDYRSDTTQFIDQMKVDKPALEAQQRQGLDWRGDKQVTSTKQKEFKTGQVAQQPYVYQTLA